MEELRKLVITNGYEFNETLNTITISKVKDELENTLNSFELEVLTTIYSLSKNGKILGE